MSAIDDWVAPEASILNLLQLRACANRDLAGVGELTDWLTAAGLTPQLSVRLFAYWRKLLVVCQG